MMRSKSEQFFFRTDSFGRQIIKSYYIFRAYSASQGVPIETFPPAVRDNVHEYDLGQVQYKIIS